ncbi:ATP-binding protein [Actinophytocola sp.]|uniref:ATP-binding protein n=1 Tax=Actinophytocola sp. TaxID=1872138 RepID=UPI002D6CE38E|nr:ATP-binding protein [Actinophytocola sp.]HYQ69085.1 ATP-binding protein [Actinophytocola sp.]
MTTTNVPAPFPEPDPMRLAVVREAALRRWATKTPARWRNAPVTDTHPAIEAWVRHLFESACRSSSGKIETGPSLVLNGWTGTGKTHAAWWAIGRLARAGVLATWEFVTAAKMYEELRPQPGRDTRARFEQLANTPLLVLDDVGAGYKQSEWTVSVDYQLVSERYDHMRPTIITTNLPTKRPPRRDDEPLDEYERKYKRVLTDVLEDRVLSRLAEMSGGPAVWFDGPDRRRGESR